MRLFSQKPVKGIKFFHENGLVEDSMEAIAKFLHSESDRLDKTAIGNHLVSCLQENRALNNFVCEIDYSPDYSKVGEMDTKFVITIIYFIFQF